MAKNMTIRIVTFLRPDLVNDPNPLSKVKWKGDNRGFTPYTGAGEQYERRFRTAHQFNIDFINKHVSEFKNTGITEKIEFYSNGDTKTTKGQVSPSCLNSYRLNDQWGASSIQFEAVSDCENPLFTGAPAINYSLHVSAWHNGDVKLYSRFDGAPDMEIYKRIDGGQWYKVYQWDSGAHGYDLFDLIRFQARVVLTSTYKIIQKRSLIYRLRFYIVTTKTFSLYQGREVYTVLFSRTIYTDFLQ